MRVLSVAVVASVLVPVIFAQRADMTPMGALIMPHPSVKVSTELKAALPKHRLVRLVQSTNMSEGGEQVVIYEKRGDFESDPHLAVVKNGRRVGDFRLTAVFNFDEMDSNYEFFKATVLESADRNDLFVAAFRNIGDGSATLFVFLAQRSGKYEVAAKFETEQGRVKVLRNGTIQIWNAPAGWECVWCPHHYKVTTYDWTDGKPARAGHFLTRHALDPEPMADNPIIFEK